MFLLLTQILLWLLIGFILYYVLLVFIPKQYLSWLGGLLILVFIALAFLNPSDPTVSSVWSILSLPLKPLGLSILLLLSALRGGTNKVVGNQVLAAFLILLLSSMPLVAYWLTGQIEQSAYRTTTPTGQTTVGPLTPIEPQTVAAIVVLGQRADQPNFLYQPGTELPETGDAGFSTALVPRILYAGQLYQQQASQGNAPLVIVTAGPRPERRDEDADEATQIRNLLLDAGVPSDRIRIESRGTDVYTSGQAVQRILREDPNYTQDTDRVIIVSSALNARRASQAFQRLGIRTYVRPTDFLVSPTRPSGLLARAPDLIPSVDALALTTRAVEEYLVSVYYFLRGWLADPF